MTAEEIEQVVTAVLEKLGVEKNPDAPLPAQEMFSIKTCAYITGVSSDHIRRAIKGGTLVASDLGTPSQPCYRVHKDNLANWLKQRESGPKPPPPRAKKQKVFSRHHKPTRQTSA